MMRIKLLTHGGYMSLERNWKQAAGKNGFVVVEARPCNIDEDSSLVEVTAEELHRVGLVNARGTPYPFELGVEAEIVPCLN